GSLTLHSSPTRRSSDISTDDDGTVLHAGDMAAQLDRAFDNLEALLSQAGLTIANVVRLNFYVTDIEAFTAAGATVGSRLQSVSRSEEHTSELQSRENSV